MTDDPDRTQDELPAPVRPHPPADDTELIAYLDGELDGPAAARVQARLSRDPAAREAAEAYKKSFDLLDYLPAPEPRPDFTSRTVTRLRALREANPTPSDSDAIPTRAPRRRVWPELLAWGTAAVLVLVLGYVGHSVARPSRAAVPADPTPAELEVIERLPLYLGVDDVAFLSKLDKAGLFAGEPPAAPPPPPAPSAAARAALVTAFRELPPDRRQQLRALHQDLTTPTARPRRATLDAYAAWLDRLPDDERAKVLAAPTAAERLVEVRQVKEAQWRATLTPRQKERLETVLSTQDREDLAAAFRRQEFRQREEWELAHRQWKQFSGKEQKPWPFDDPSRAADVEAFIRGPLGVDLSGPPPERRGFQETQPRCRISRDQFVELKTLHEATRTGGPWAWLQYGACLSRLADANPSLPLPADAKKAVTGMENLPKEYRFFGMSNPKSGLRMIQALGKWPDYALAVHQESHRRPKGFGGGGPLPQLGPCRPGEYSAEVSAFLKGPLAAKLSAAESADLRGTEGKWPDHSRRLMELARKHDLAVPGVTLPGEPSQWDARYRLLGGGKR